jgi:hypothetical protein
MYAPGVVVVPTNLEGDVPTWKSTGRSRDATSDEITAYTTAHTPPSGGGGGASSFADLTGDPTDNAALAAILDEKAAATDLAAKADASTVNTALAAKADTSAVNTALAAKADASALAAKADSSSVTSGLASKADASAVTALAATVAGKADSSAVPSLQDVIWGTTYDTIGGTTFTGVGTNSLSKTNNDSNFRTGGFGTVQLTNEGIFRYIAGITPSDSSTTGLGSLSFGLSHSNAMSPSGVFYFDVEYACNLNSNPELREAGVQVATFTAAKGDVFEFRIAKDSQGVRVVTFWKNNSLVWKFASTPTMPLYLVNCVYHQNRSMACKYSTTLL